jgi:hypothetical protein
MMRWEYLIWSHVDMRTGTIYAINRKSTGPAGVSLHDELARIGNAGWELVANDEDVIVFRRPKAEERGR